MKLRTPKVFHSKSTRFPDRLWRKMIDFGNDNEEIRSENALINFLVAKGLEYMNGNGPQSQETKEERQNDDDSSKSEGWDDINF